ncbi:hypothetical protein CQW23_32228 [Capsicum baccatum]|uniref:Uncharacterized protein n=1 Tax=Capsicum baccatum TaxID=33114 RepID=A0A2G2V5E2_CAPBA|nr:hypothetical protein CQW23_32228 [Capsicum baccatum]
MYNFDIVKVSPILDAFPILQSLQILQHKTYRQKARGSPISVQYSLYFTAHLMDILPNVYICSWCQGSGMVDKDNSNELASPVTSVKNDSMAEDNTDELVSLVTSVKNDSMDEDNIDELVSPVTSVKNDSAGSNTRRKSTGKLNAPDSGQDVIPHYLRASTGSFHDFCKYGRKHSSEAKPWHSLSKRKNKLPADEQSPARTLVGVAKKGTLVKQKLSTPGSVLGEKKKVIGVEQKPSTSPGSMLGEAIKRTMVMQKTSTTSRSN